MKSATVLFYSLVESNVYKFTDEEFIEYDNVIGIPSEYDAYVRMWLTKEMLSNQNSYISETLESMIESLDSSKSLKIGINFTYGNKPFSIYTFNGIVFITSPKNITLNLAKEIIGV